MLLPSAQLPSWRQTKPHFEWWNHFREVGTTTVMHVDLSPHAEREMSALAWLDTGERSSRQCYLHLGAQRRFTMCRAALRIILCGQLACRNEQLSFGISRHGKPFALVDGIPAAISFNVSHSGNHGLIALASAGQLGVDIEEYVPRRYLDQLAESDSVFTSNERAELAQIHGDDRVRLFTRLWTIKEALLKALGTGLSIDISKLEVPPVLLRGTTSTFRFPHKPTVEWYVEYIGNDMFAAAVAQEII